MKLLIKGAHKSNLKLCYVFSICRLLHRGTILLHESILILISPIVLINKKMFVLWLLGDSFDYFGTKSRSVYTKVSTKPSDAPTSHPKDSSLKQSSNSRKNYVTVLLKSFSCSGMKKTHKNCKNPIHVASSVLLCISSETQKEISKIHQEKKSPGAISKSRQMKHGRKLASASTQ